MERMEGCHAFKISDWCGSYGNKVIGHNRLYLSSVSEIQEKLYLMSEKIDEVKDLKRSLLENSQRVKKEIQSQVNDIVNLLRDRGQKLCEEVEEYCNEENLFIQEQLYRMHLGYAQWHTIHFNLMKFDEKETFVNLSDKFFVENFEEKVPKRLLAFDSQFEDLKSVIQTFGEVKCIPYPEIITLNPSGSSDPRSGKFENEFTSEDISLNGIHNIIYEKPSDSIESFEIVDSPEDLTLHNYISESIEEKKEDVRNCTSLNGINMGSFSSDCCYKSIKVTDWLDKSSEIENSSTSMEKLEKNKTGEPLHQLKKQLQKIMSDNCGINNNVDFHCKLSDQIPVSNYYTKSINNPVSATRESFQKKARSLVSSNIQQWLQNPVSSECSIKKNQNPVSFEHFLKMNTVSSESVWGNYNMVMQSVSATKNEEYSPAECIQQALSSYFEKENSAKWLLNYSSFKRIEL